MIGRQIRRVGLTLIAAFVAVFFQLNYIQIFAAERIASNDANIRRLIAEYSIKRGDILTADGKIIAVSKPTKGRLKFVRTYPFGDLYGHITGYHSVFFGADRIERSFNDQLLGEGGVISMQDVEDRFLGSGEQGDDLVLTIHSELQRIAREALGADRGAVVAMDPQTGEVRAMWSNPSFDPGPIASHDSKTARAYWESLEPGSPTSPLLNVATSRSFPPGSTMKVVTTAAALREGFKADDTFPDPRELELPLSDETLTNFTKEPCTTGGEIDLFEALRVSCDTTFAMLGLEIPHTIFEIAESMSFNAPMPFDIATGESVYPDVPADEAPLGAYAAIGQGDTAATPLQMAVVASAIGNGGEVPRPRLVRDIIDVDGSVVESFDYESLGEALSAEDARTITEMMVAVVESGTGTAARIEGIQVAGKTGTAQSTKGASPHAWFIAFAPAADPQIAVAVFVENGGSFGSEATGGAVAAPIARRIIEADKAIRGW
ncbi:MAG TPA: penicillin-binding transpeptidase domain-containing protein [Actinomycetota bacterium]|nr:penicillin-binding transpeptidase domain-containing protein [Actinomycetota bacterium]